MTSMVKQSEFELISAAAICVAIMATMFVTYLCLAYAEKLLKRIGMGRRFIQLGQFVAFAQVCKMCHRRQYRKMHGTMRA